MDKSKNLKTIPKSLVASVMQSAMATDYRIGNIIQYNNEIESTGTITSLIADFVAGLDYCQIDYRTNEKHWLINVKPIQLTEQWLEKLGFSVIKESSAGKRYGYVINGIFSSDLTFTFWKTTKEAGKFFRGDLELKSVHQLQNLYFALTQRELAVA